MTEPGSSGFGADATRERAREGLDHLQAAARELINAARAALDVAEGLIDDPDVLKAMMSAAGRLGDVLRTVDLERPRRTTGENGPSEVDGASSARSTPSVERITIR